MAEPVSLFPPRWCFPYLAAAFLMLSCVSSVAVSFYLNHVSGIPYISDTITTPPESCIFGFILNLYSVLLGISIWNVYSTAVDKNRMEAVACCVGLSAALAVAVVANFQETEVFAIHIVGAMTAFSLASVYIWMRLALSPKMRTLRIVCAVFCTITVVITAATGAVAFSEFRGKSILHWGKDEGGYELHVASVISEWILAFFVNVFVITLVEDIRCSEEQQPLMARVQRDNENGSD